jgi:curved DNA-binding protein CbpA
VATLELLDKVESWLNILDQVNYYELLGVLEIADETAIQEAFHDFSKSFHPDRHRGEPLELLTALTKIYQRGSEAYGSLRDPKLRAQYDLALSQGTLRLSRGLTAHDSSAQEANLASLARTKGGQLHARQAERALSAGNLTEAEQLIQRAILAEGTNPGLEARAEELFALVRVGRLVSG